jgi:hypothetical protein
MPQENVLDYLPLGHSVMKFSGFANAHLLGRDRLHCARRPTHARSDSQPPRLSDEATATVASGILMPSLAHAATQT